MIKTFNYNLFNDHHRVIIHGCNCSGVMGSGFAKELRVKYPKAYDDYHKYCVNALNNSQDIMGKVVMSKQPGNTIVYNCITQSKYGRGALKYVSYDAIDESLQSISENISPDIALAMPKIGAGLGGGNWSVIKEIVNHRLSNFSIVNVYEI